MMRRAISVLTALLLLAACGPQVQIIMPTGTTSLTADAQTAQVLTTQNAALTATAIVATATRAAEQTVLAASQETLAAAETALHQTREATKADIVTAPGATATPLATLTLTLTPTLTPPPAATGIAWRLVELPELGLQMQIPAEFEGPSTDNTGTVTFVASAGPDALSLITLSRQNLSEILPDIDLSHIDTTSPVSALYAALSGPTEQGVQVLEEPHVYDALPYPAAITRLRVTEGEDMILILLLIRLGESDWVASTVHADSTIVDIWAREIFDSLQIGGARDSLTTATPPPAREVTTPTPTAGAG